LESGVGKIRIHPVQDIELKKIGDRAGTPRHKAFDLMDQSELDSSMTFHEFGSEHVLQLAELQYIPYAKAVVHKHDDDEIIYVLSGEMHLGNQVLEAGSSMYIPGNTYYGFTAGPKGLRVLNFRASADVSVHFKNDN
jgi:quercetin dioxygenase-like cupin family protein